MAIIEMPKPDPEILRLAGDIVIALKRAVGEAAVISEPGETIAYECDAFLRLSLRASGGGAADLDRGGCGGAAGLLALRRAGGGARIGHLAVGRRAADAGFGRHRRRPHEPGAGDDYEDRFIRVEAGITNLGVSDADRGRRFLLRARPVEPARLRDRRQHRDEFRRRPLPEIRRHHQQSARRAHGAHGRRDRRYRRAASRCRRPRPARRRLRLGRPVRHRYRGAC